MWPAKGAADDDSSDNDDFNSQSNHACISEEVKKNLLLVLESEPRGLNLDALDNCYRDKIGRKLDFRKHGFDSLEDMIKVVQEIR